MPKLDAEDDQIVNIGYLKAQSPYVKQENDPEEKDQKKFWIGPNNCLSAYDPVKKWNSVFAEVGLFLKALNTDTEKPTKPNDYSNFFKFIGKRKVSVLALDDVDTTSEYATVFGLRADEDEPAYEFIIVDGHFIMRAGKGDTWEEQHQMC